MALANGFRLIWSDTYICEAGQNEDLKKRFRTTLGPLNVMPPDTINSLICSLNEHVAPFLFAESPDRAIALIEEHSDKTIIFISSGSLGQHLIPVITKEYPQVHSFYFFCAIPENYIDLLFDYSNCLQIFTNETDLLVRITRDVSRDIIKQGEKYLALNDGKNALKCFDHAQTLNETANGIDSLNPPYLEHLRILRGHGGTVGLIQRAKDLLDPQQQSQAQSQHPSAPPQLPVTADDDDDTPVSQQESGEYA